MTASDGKNVDLAHVPTYLGDFLRSHLSVYYNANVEFEEEEEETVESDEENMVEEENSVPPVEGEVQHEQPNEQGDEDTESESEVEKQPASTTEAIGSATHADTLPMKFCSEALDPPDLGSPSC